MNLAAFLLAITAVSATASMLLIEPTPRLLWNASASVPPGLYLIRPARQPGAGDMVAIMPPPALARWMAERHYLPLHVPLLKKVGALPGQHVCRNGTRIHVDLRQVALALEHDRNGRQLPIWQGCRTVRNGEIFLLNAASTDSLDGRYFGPIRSVGLLGTAVPILTRAGPGESFRWHSPTARPTHGNAPGKGEK